MVCDTTPRYTETLAPVVLILILLEYGLRQWTTLSTHCRSTVLILILLEYGLRQRVIAVSVHGGSRLNPYSIGIWSATPKIANH